MALPRALRDVLLFVAIMGILLGAVYLYTGTWPPAVIVESGSMMHADSEVSYGRIGTIDPGDLVLVKKVTSPSDVTTLVENGHHTYGKAGDVIVYFPANSRSATPIIHRAVAYVEVVGSGASATYRVRWDPHAPCEGGATQEVADGATWCDYDSNGVLIPSVPVRATAGSSTPFKPTRSGFITKGDNPVTNTEADPAARISHDANGAPSDVPMEWIEGKARGEIPWVGLIKLALAGRPNESNPPSAWVRVLSAYAPKDLWVMLGIMLVIVVVGPIAYDVVKARRAKR